MGIHKCNNVLKYSEEVTENLISSGNKTNVVQSNETHTKAITYSAALEATGYGFINYYLIFVSGIVLTAVLMELSAVGFILPIAQCDLNLTNQEKGAIMSISYFGIICSSHLWGFLADTKGRKTIMMPTLLISFFTVGLSSFSTNFWMMFVFKFVNGFLIAGGSATIYAYLGEFLTDKTRSKAMMASAVFFGVTSMSLPVIAFFVINKDWALPFEWLGIVYKPWRFFLVICSVPGLISGLCFLLLPESPKFLLSQGKEVECYAALQQMYKWNRGKNKLEISQILPDDDEITEAKIFRKENLNDSNLVVVFFHSMWQQTTPLFSRKYLRTTLIACTVKFWVYVAINGMYMWFPHIINSMAEHIKNHPEEPKQMCHIVYEKEANFYQNNETMVCVTKLEEKTYAYSLIMEILYTLSFVLIGVVINKLGKRLIIFICMVFFTFCGVMGVLIYDPAVAAYFYVLFFLVGVAINVLEAILVELYPTQLRATAISISLMVGRCGSVFGANIFGSLLGSHCELTFYVTCGWLLFCALLILFLPKNQATQEIKNKSRT